MILDGWGIAPPGPGNAVELARTPVFDDLVARVPDTRSSRPPAPAVGLPEGQMGNSEVGHLTIGSGRILFQDLVRVTRAVEDGSLFENAALVGAFRRAQERGGAVHLLGLVSNGGVHSHIDHLRALLELARAGGDGGADVGARVHRRPRRLAARGRRRPRDAAAPSGSRRSSAATTRWTATSAGSAPIARSPRSATAIGEEADDPVAAVRASYERGVTDEFVEPIVARAAARGSIPATDAAIFFNFRPDRGRQLARAAARGGRRPVTMTRYATTSTVPSPSASRTCADTLAETLARHGLAPAPRRRDGEVRARHVLLQRRRRGAVAGRGRASSSRRRATSRATT